MAHRVIHELIDDLDGESPASETVRFSLENQQFEIDLSEENASKLREVLLPYTSAVRKVGRGGVQLRLVQGSRPARSTADKERLQAVRSWAQSQGLDVHPRGRIPNSVIEAYDAAMANPEPVVETAAPAKRTRRKPKAEPEFVEAG